MAFQKDCMNQLHILKLHPKACLITFSLALHIFTLKHLCSSNSLYLVVLIMRFDYLNILIIYYLFFISSSELYLGLLSIFI